SALIARQTEMATIGSNIAKADMEGYRRQEAVLVANSPLGTGNLQIGTGTYVEQVIRNFDLALETNLQNSLEQEYYFKEYYKQIQTLEQVVAQEGDSMISEAMTLFADSLQDLATDPQSESLRRSMLANAERLAETFNQQYSMVTDVRDQIVSSSTVGVIPDKVNEFNSLASELASLNNLIVNTEQSMIRNQKAIDFRDQRDQVVKEMAKLADVTIAEQADGSYTLTVGDVATVTMVTGGTVNDTLSHVLTAGPPPTPTITWAVAGTALDSPTGAIDGLKDAYDFIQARLTDIETYATNLAAEMNAQHALGFDLSGTAGGNLFDATTAGAMTVLITDPDDVAAADNATNTGDGDNALAMWNALHAPVVGIGNDTLRNHADRIVDLVAIEKNRAETLLRSSSSSVDMFKSLISEKSGVSIDEEMVDMLETQRAFQGAARFIRAVDELIQTVINIV
ncbi:MAG: flagellar hook-associated protein FlgK, partial [Lentisphaeraceae bacterium]|nr:flagellar hook-associated protein FlgK [Lentisphaeraceae bacterium]